MSMTPPLMVATVAMCVFDVDVCMFLVAFHNGASFFTLLLANDGALVSRETRRQSATDLDRWTRSYFVSLDYFHFLTGLFSCSRMALFGAVKTFVSCLQWYFCALTNRRGHTQDKCFSLGSSLLQLACLCLHQRGQNLRSLVLAVTVEAISCMFPIAYLSFSAFVHMMSVFGQNTARSLLAQKLMCAPS